MDTRSVRSGVLFLACIAVPLLVGMTGSFFTVSNIATWYAALAKPAISPPNWVFGPVWTILYILMGISLYLVLRDGRQNTLFRQATFLFALQLAVNLLWSIIFFGMHAVFFALACILALLVLIVATIITFFRVSKPAGWMLVPYLCWVSFASVLNAMIWLLN